MRLAVEETTVPPPATKENHKKAKKGNSQPNPTPIRTSPWNADLATPTQSTEHTTSQHNMGSKASASNSISQPGNKATSARDRKAAKTVAMEHREAPQGPTSSSEGYSQAAKDHAHCNTEGTRASGPFVTAAGTSQPGNTRKPKAAACNLATPARMHQQPPAPYASSSSSEGFAGASPVFEPQPREANRASTRQGRLTGRAAEPPRDLS
eukprot:8311012-Heterocapsa_arctica.AAC.1